MLEAGLRQAGGRLEAGLRASRITEADGYAICITVRLTHNLQLTIFSLTACTTKSLGSSTQDIQGLPGTSEDFRGTFEDFQRTSEDFRWTSANFQRTSGGLPVISKGLPEDFWRTSYYNNYYSYYYYCYS